MLLTEHKECPPLLPMYVAINLIITTFIYSEFIPKIHCHILFMSKPFSQSICIMFVSQIYISDYRF
jgi:hypothetical protein